MSSETTDILTKSNDFSLRTKSSFDDQNKVIVMSFTYTLATVCMLNGKKDGECKPMIMSGQYICRHCLASLYSLRVKSLKTQQQHCILFI